MVSAAASFRSSPDAITPFGRRHARVLFEAAAESRLGLVPYRASDGRYLARPISKQPRRELEPAANEPRKARGKHGP